jgi:hypothetical protein
MLKSLPVVSQGTAAKMMQENGVRKKALKCMCQTHNKITKIIFQLGCLVETFCFR